MVITVRDVCCALDMACILNAQACVTGFSSDSNAIKPGMCFIALQGHRVDGHDYVAQAFHNGAVMAVVMRDMPGDCVKVADTYQALLDIALWLRKSCRDIPMVSMTGSCGKTSTRDLLASVLQSDRKVLYSQGSFNNAIGVPFTLFKLVEQPYDCIVQELGANHLGEIAALVQVAMPQHVIITNIAACHIEGFGSLDGVAKAKSEILDERFLLGDGVAILPADSPYYDFLRSKVVKRRLISFGIEQHADVFADKIVLLNDGLQFRMHILNESCDISSNLLGQHNIYNMLAAAAGAYAMGISVDQIQKGIMQAAAVGGRLQLKAGIHNSIILDDSYNANPHAMQAALQVLALRQGVRVLVVGDMGELGDVAVESHQQIGAFAKQLGIDRLYAYGDMSRHCVTSFGDGACHFTVQSELIECLLGDMGMHESILVKGSNCMKMNEVVAALAAKEHE